MTITVDENDDGHWSIYADGIKVDVFHTLDAAQDECRANNWKIDKIKWNAKVTENWGIKRK